MLPLISPANLEKLFRLRIIEGSNGYPGINNDESEVWEASNNWYVYKERLVPEDAGLAGFEKLPTHLKKWLKHLSFKPGENIEGIAEMTGFTKPRDIDAERKRHGMESFLLGNLVKSRLCGVCPTPLAHEVVPGLCPNATRPDGRR